MHFDDSSCARCRADFPALGRTHAGRPLAYFDGPGGTQVPQAVIDAVTSYYATSNANTHGQFVTAEESDLMLLAAREAVASFLGAPSWQCISFGANMTTLTFALARAFGRRLGPGDEVVITELDHEANRGPWLTLAARGVTVRQVALRSDGTLDPDDMARQVTGKTRLLAIGYASNALGTVNDLALARRLTRAVGATLVVDAVHAAPHFSLDVTALDCDMLLCSAYKFYGPHVGVLYVRPGLLDTLATERLSTQEPEAPYRIETGTLNHAAIAGVNAAIAYLASWGQGDTLRSRLVDAMSGLEARERTLATRYFDDVRQVPGVTVWGPDFSAPRRAPTVSISIAGVHPTEAARRLGERGVCVWDGHFYAARAIEVLGQAETGGVIRAGMAMYVSEDDIDRLLDGVRALARG